MTPRKWIVAAALSALVVFPAAASAQPSVRDVAEQVRGADTAFELAQQAAQQGDVQDLLAALQSERGLTGKANRMAGRVFGTARRARAERQVAVHVDGSFDVLAAIIDEVPPEVQPIVLDAIAHSSAARDELIAKLTELAGQLPAQARDALLAAITAMQTDGDLNSIVDAIDSDAIGAGIKAGLTDILGEVSSRLDDALANLDELVGMLPPDAQQQVQDAIDAISGHFADVMAILDGVLGSLPEQGGVCDLLGQLGIPLPLCS